MNMNRTEFIGTNLYYSQDFVDDLYKEINKQKEVLDKIKEYVKNDYDRNQEVVDYCGFDKFYNHILEILEEIE